MKSVIGLLLIVGCAVGVCQQGTTPSNQASSTGDASQHTPGQFYDKDLDVHFNYPVEMRVLDAAADMESGHLNIYGSSGDNDPEHQEAKRCMRPLLDAELPEDKAPKRMASMDGVWIDDSPAYKDSRKPEPIFAKIVFTEVIKSCLPKQLQKHENDALGTLAMSAVSEPGLQRMEKPLWYDVGGQKIHMNSSAGRPIVNGQVSPAPVLTMAMSTSWRGHWLVWVFLSNDTETFNELTKSIVQFGNGKWGPMFAANIGPKGTGTPMTILPN